MQQPISISFEAKPDEGIILCRRSDRVDIRYKQRGIHPSVRALTYEDRVGFQAALDVMGWTWNQET